MESSGMHRNDAKQEVKPAYVPPMIKIMEEKDLLADFQISVNANSWWAAM